MMKHVNIFVIFLWLLAAAVASESASAQRRVTPVKSLEPGTAPAPEKPAGPDLSHIVHMHDAQGNVVLVDTVTGLEVPDTTGMLLPAPPKMEYPLLYTMTFGVNAWDGLMRAFGQNYGLTDVMAEINFHNRYLVSATVGAGIADLSPTDKNFTFKAPLSPYFKIGADYNFLYNSNPDYKLMFGVRYGLSPFRWGLEDVRVPDSYWQDPTVYSLPTTSHTTGWIEVSLGIRVRIVSQLSLGWRIIYQSVLHDSSSPHGLPMYIPGFGKRGNPLSAAFTISWTIPFPSKDKKDDPAATSPVLPDAPERDLSTETSPSEITEND